jgi:hypothetical protein
MIMMMIEMYFVSDSMGQSIFRKAKDSSASQEISLILWKPNVRHRVHKSLLLVHILSQINPVHALPVFLYLLLYSCSQDCLIGVTQCYIGHLTVRQSSRMV